ncbi:MAG TPA: DUF1858 domain-containing protein [Thermoanaerobaculaceae bacterium]|nr:DUF1858 domain-containing protein [Thermoanaerobaculaceae bacterium]
MGARRAKPTPALTVAELLRRWPAAGPVLIGRGMACPGCAMAPFDTVRVAAETYGFDEDALLDEVRRAGRGARASSR